MKPADEIAATKRLAAAIFRRGLDDVVALLQDKDVPTGGPGHALSQNAKATLLRETLDWLLDPVDESPCSMIWCCAVVGLDVDAIQRQVWALADGAIKVKTRRRKLSAAERQQILALLAAEPERAR